MTRTRRTPLRPRGKTNVPTMASATPDGSAADVLAWVGEDASRARQAIEHENASDRPRSVLLRTLHKLAGGDDE